MFPRGPPLFHIAIPRVASDRAAFPVRIRQTGAGLFLSSFFIPTGYLGTRSFRAMSPYEPVQHVFMNSEGLFRRFRKVLRFPLVISS